MTMRILAIAALACMVSGHAAWADVPPGPPSGSCGGTHQVRIVPVMATHVLPPYPPDAVTANEQGNSILRVAIAPSGAVTDDTLVQSSGSDRLDAAALDFVKKTWRWEPMPDCRTPVSVAVSVSWRLKSRPVFDPAQAIKLMRFVAAPPDAYPSGAPKVKSVVMMMGSVSDTGEWHKLMIMPGMGDPALFEKSDALAHDHRWTPLHLDGKPIGGIALVGVIWTPPGETPIDPGEFPKMIEMMMPHNAAPAPNN